MNGELKVAAVKGCVAEITDGRLYDVRAIDGEVLAERVPAWVARLITAVEPYPPLVSEHRSVTGMR